MNADDGRIEPRWRVERIGDDLGKHVACAVFVLDFEHDPYAIPEALSYAAAAAKEFPILAENLIRVAMLHAPIHRAALIRGHWPYELKLEGIRKIREVLARRIEFMQGRGES